MPFLWRLAQDAVPLVPLVVAARLLGADPASLFLRPARRAEVGAALAVSALIVPAAALLGPILAVFFFAPLHLGGDLLSALLPAVILAIANSLAEELAFRGALLGWGSRLLGANRALLLQAGLFGLLHQSADFQGDPLPVLVVVAAAGLAAGLLVRRSGSLVPVLILHAAFDVPLFWVQLCRLP